LKSLENAIEILEKEFEGIEAKKAEVSDLLCDKIEEKQKEKLLTYMNACIYSIHHLLKCPQEIEHCKWKFNLPKGMISVQHVQGF